MPRMRRQNLQHATTNISFSDPVSIRRYYVLTHVYVAKARVFYA